MGTIRHHAIVVTFGNYTDAAKAHKLAKDLFTSQVSGVIGPVTNGYFSFFIGPDGSKEGWRESNSLNARRAWFLNLLEDLRESGAHSEYVEVSYGADGGAAAVTSDSASGTNSIQEDGS